jgi:hypothetical protein
VISHPTTDFLLDKHGNTREGRKRARMAMAKAIRETGERMIADEQAVAGKSIRCARGDHLRLIDGGTAGCQNGGATCICECHDGAAP